MPDVHPTATIAPEATLADDAVVGPHCRVLGPVTLGPGVRLLHRVTLQGPVHVGPRTRIYPNATLGPPATFAPTTGATGPSDGGPASDSATLAAPDHEGGDPDQPVLIVGEDVVIREGVRIAPGTADRPTRIGRGVYLMVNGRIGAGAAVGEYATIVNGVRIGEAAEVGPNALLGGNATVAPGCRLGRLATVTGGAEFTRDVPPFCTAYYADRVGSLNLVGLRRNAGRSHIRALRRAFKLLYRGAGHNGSADGIDPAAAVDRIEAELADDPLCAELTAFIRDTHRGIAPYANAAKSRDSG